MCFSPSFPRHDINCIIPKLELAAFDFTVIFVVFKVSFHSQFPIVECDSDVWAGENWNEWGKLTYLCDYLRVSAQHIPHITLLRGEWTFGGRNTVESWAHSKVPSARNFIPRSFPTLIVKVNEKTFSFSSPSSRLQFEFNLYEFRV